MATWKPTRRRRKSEEEDEIDLSYYANSPTLQGMLSHLKPELHAVSTGVVTSAEAAGAEAISAPLVSSRVVLGGVDSSPVDASEYDLVVADDQPGIGAATIKALPVLTRAVTSHVDLDSAVTSDDAFVAVVTSSVVHSLDGAIPSLGRRRVLYVGHSAPSAHSALENQFYNWAWRHAAPVDGDRRCLRGSPAKIGVIAREMNITGRSTIELLKRMIEKLVLEVCAGWVHGRQEGKSYFIHSLREILDRRRRAGLEYAIKGKGIILINREQAQALEAANRRPVVLENYGDAQPSAE